MKNIFYIIALAATTIVSCKKDKSTNSTSTAFSGGVELTSPHEGDTVSGNFPVNGAITGNMEMHGYHIGVYRRDNEDLIYENQYHTHASSYSIAETINTTLTDTTDLKVVIEAVVEHEGESVTKTVNFVYKP